MSVLSLPEIDEQVSEGRILNNWVDLSQIFYVIQAVEAVCPEGVDECFSTLFISLWGRVI